MIKPDKIFECVCPDGFTGEFCEFKTEQDHLLFVSAEWNGNEMINNSLLVFNASGTLIEESVVSIGEQAGAYLSCSTMLNGEAIIFGGWDPSSDSNIKQVHLKSICISLKYYPF